MEEPNVNKATVDYSIINPYDTNNIPADDLYADEPLYGRYLPRPDEFKVDSQHVNSQSAASLQYWTSVLALCEESHRLHPPLESCRDVFALGNLIVKSDHLRPVEETTPQRLNVFLCADANEAQAIELARSALKEVKVPKIFFHGEERIAGVGLNVAWPYLSQHQKQSFKTQTREILQQLHTIKPPKGHQARSYVYQSSILHGIHRHTNHRCADQEFDILFSSTNRDPDMSLMHNDLNTSNIIVDDDKIVAIIDWEMAGWFGWKTAGTVHRELRSPRREWYVNANLSEEELQDLTFWLDLYDVETPKV